MHGDGLICLARSVLVNVGDILRDFPMRLRAGSGGTCLAISGCLLLSTPSQSPIKKTYYISTSTVLSSFSFASQSFAVVSSPVSASCFFSRVVPRRRAPSAAERALAELLRALVTPKWLIIMPVLPSSPSPWIGSRAFDHSICHAHKAIFISVMVTSAPHAVINNNNARFTTVLGVSIMHSAKVTKDRWHTTPPYPHSRTCDRLWTVLAHSIVTLKPFPALVPPPSPAVTAGFILVRVVARVWCACRV